MSRDQGAFYRNNMSKDPAFLFYPNDYIGGTMGMTFEEKGAYIDLLMLQFNRGHMTSRMVGQVLGQLEAETRGLILTKFLVDEEGCYYNERLEIEIEKRKNYIISRNNNLLGKNQHKNKGGHTGGHMTSHTENENENENRDKNVVEIYHSLCPKLNKVVVLNDLRKGFINARVAEFGLEKITSVFRLAGESDFLNGKNDKAWKADFEWILRPTNFIKIMEGKYNNTNNTPKLDQISYKELIYRFNQGETDMWEKYEQITPGDKRSMWKLKYK